MPTTRIWMPLTLRILTIAMILGLLHSLLIALDVFPSLRGDFGWRWPYALPEVGRLLPAVVVVIVYAWGALRLLRSRWLLTWCFAGAVLIPLACLYLLGDPFYLLATRTLSGQATGPHLAGAYISDLGATLRAWPQIMKTYLDPQAHIMISGHVALSPPGLPLVYYGLDRIFDAMPVLADPLGMALRPLQCQNFGIMGYSNATLASAWFGILMPVWAALAVFPIRRLGGKLAAIWWPLVPSLAMFATTWNTLYPLVGLWAFLLLAAGLRAPTLRWPAWVRIFFAGVLISAATFANISIVPLLGVMGLYTLLVRLRGKWAAGPALRQEIGRLLTIGLVFGLGLISVWVVYYAMSGVTPVTLFGQALGQHLGYENERPYLPWVVLHPYELLMFTGLPLSLAALLALWPGRSSVPAATLDDGKHQSADRTEMPALPDQGALAVSLFITLLVIALSGTARGETGRVWLFFSPFILIAAAWAIQRLPTEQRQAGQWLVTAAQVITLLILIAFLRTMDTELTRPPVQPPTSISTAGTYDALPSAATFAGAFTLIGQRAVAHDRTIDLTLAWQAERQAERAYYLSALIVGPDGQPVGKAINWQAFETHYPTTCWRPGQQVVETVSLPLDAAKPGDYWISLSAFDVHDGQNVQGVPVMLPGAAPDTQVGLGPVHVTR